MYNLSDHTKDGCPYANGVNKVNTSPNHEIYINKKYSHKVKAFDTENAYTFIRASIVNEYRINTFTIKGNVLRRFLESTAVLDQRIIVWLKIMNGS